MTPKSKQLLKMNLDPLLPLLLLLLSPTAYSIEPPIAETNEHHRNQDQLLSLLDRHEAQLNRLETLIESLSKSVDSIEKSSLLSTARLQPSISSPHSLPQPSHKLSFSTKLTLSALARLDSDPTYIAPLPYTDSTGGAAYFAAGGARGNGYVISTEGKISLELPAVSDSPVTCILSYPIKKNQSFIYTGHKDGSVVVHRVIGSDGGDDGRRLVLLESRQFVRGSRDLDSSLVVALELHVVRLIRYIVVAEDGGRIRVFTEVGGTLYGTAIASGKVLAFMMHRLLFLTERGAGSLDLRSMTAKERECEGLNGYVAQRYIFDRSDMSKAYGFTEGGDLIHVVLIGDASNFKCRVRSIRKTETDTNHVSMTAVRGYLLASTLDKFYVYNISSQYYGRVGAPRPLFFSRLEEIKSTLLSPDDITNIARPLVSSDREKVVVLSLGGGYIGVYRSELPTYKPVMNSAFWVVPVVVFLVFLVGMWQFYVKKKDSFVWAPEEAFDITLTSDVMRGLPRRYVSPCRFPISTDDAAAAASDRSDLRYRGRTFETSAGFVPRREQLFMNHPLPDEHSD